MAALTNKMDDDGRGLTEDKEFDSLSAVHGEDIRLGAGEQRG